MLSAGALRPPPWDGLVQVPVGHVGGLQVVDGVEDDVLPNEAGGGEVRGDAHAGTTTRRTVVAARRAARPTRARSPVPGGTRALDGPSRGRNSPQGRSTTASARGVHHTDPTFGIGGRSHPNHGPEPHPATPVDGSGDGKRRGGRAHVAHYASWLITLALACRRKPPRAQLENRGCVVRVRLGHRCGQAGTRERETDRCHPNIC